MQGFNQQGPAAEEAIFSVPAMTCRHCVRAVSAQLRDVKGVVAVKADSSSRTVRVQGTAPSHALRSAIADAGYDAAFVGRSERSHEPAEPSERST